MIIKRLGITNGKKNEISFLSQKLYKELRTNYNKICGLFFKIKFEIVKSKFNEELYIITAYEHCNFFIVFLLIIAEAILVCIESFINNLCEFKKILKMKKPEYQYSINEIRKEFGVKE
ncbi:MAG TPA: hypothetical protein K8V87_04715 [Fusobacterium ulcerans]|jgi:hypothetical protein|uniref:hypothetical protein n=1 Tax=Fusobacterium ulcerans TaxID=861 RepID=UPI000E4E9990|nr:hypothetical protein [Fusobacterium ulcerans]RGY66693.1 hypothetical protein DXA30_02765 [Fusobacterium ulcerans]HJH06984.1 hypothetical protein [Fusobacterium ulcerans]